MKRVRSGIKKNLRGKDDRTSLIVRAGVNPETARKTFGFPVKKVIVDYPCIKTSKNTRKNNNARATNLFVGVIAACTLFLAANMPKPQKPEPPKKPVAVKVTVDVSKLLDDMYRANASLNLLLAEIGIAENEKGELQELTAGMARVKKLSVKAKKVINAANTADEIKALFDTHGGDEDQDIIAYTAEAENILKRGSEKIERYTSANKN